MWIDLNSTTRVCLNAEWADYATRLGNQNIGSNTEPIHLINGIPVAGEPLLALSGGTMTGTLNFENNIGIKGFMGGGSDYWTLKGSGTDDNGVLQLTIGDNATTDFFDIVFSDWSDEVEDFTAMRFGKNQITANTKIVGTEFVGNATTASRLQTARTISLTGAVTGSGSFDGSGNLTISTSAKYLPLSGGTMTGDIYFATIASWPTVSGETYPIVSKKISWSGSSDGVNLFYRVTASDKGEFVIQMFDATDERVVIENNSGVIYSTIGYNGVTGAVWNDYAEYRICKDKFKPGQVIVENGDDTMSISTARLQPGAEIVSDTFGFSIGETDDAKCPIAVSGRVLAYPYEDKYSYQPGDAVCSGPNGTISRMTREEIREYPERIIGTVSAIPEYEEWGTGKVKVDGRIWIKVR